MILKWELLVNIAVGIGAIAAAFRLVSSPVKKLLERFTKLEEQDKKFAAELQTISAKLDSAEQTRLRLELLHLLDHKPLERKSIMDAYRNYKALGGNTYMDELYNEWLTGGNAND